MFQATSVEHRIAPGHGDRGFLPFAVFFFLLIFLAFVPSDRPPLRRARIRRWPSDSRATASTKVSRLLGHDHGPGPGRVPWVGTEDGLSGSKEAFPPFRNRGRSSRQYRSLVLGRPRGIWATTSKGSSGGTAGDSCVREVSVSRASTTGRVLPSRRRDHCLHFEAAALLQLHG